MTFFSDPNQFLTPQMYEKAEVQDTVFMARQQNLEEEADLFIIHPDEKAGTCHIWKGVPSQLTYSVNLLEGYKALISMHEDEGYRQYKQVTRADSLCFIVIGYPADFYRQSDAIHRRFRAFAGKDKEFLDYLFNEFNSFIKIHKRIIYPENLDELAMLHFLIEKMRAVTVRNIIAQPVCKEDIKQK